MEPFILLFIVLAIIVTPILLILQSPPPSCPHDLDDLDDGKPLTKFPPDWK